ncbi:hypothetical protein GCM10023069_53510 [Shinella granuli]
MEPHRSRASRPVSKATPTGATILRARALLQPRPDAHGTARRQISSGKVPRVTECVYPVIYCVAEGGVAPEPIASPRIPLGNGGPEC